MRYILLIAALLILAACGSPATPAPTATAVIPPTDVPPTGEPVSIGDNPLGTLAATMSIPDPGTLVVPSDIETPNAPTDVPITIDQLGFTQSGGLAGATLIIVLKGDGTLTRNDQTSTVSTEQVQNIAAILDRIHFFDLNGIFTGPDTAPDTYRYSLVVESAGRSRTINSQDGLTPPELAQLYDAIRALGGA